MIQTNIYPIENLKELSCKYRLYKIRGIAKDSSDYEKNIQQLVQKLRKDTESPCVIVKEGSDTLVAQPSGLKDMPNSVPLVGANVLIEKSGIEKELYFDKLNENDADIAIAFLQSSLQGPLWGSDELWLPHSSTTCYQKTPDDDFRNMSKDVDMFKGFKFRLIRLPDNRIGISVDVSRKYISRYPLPTKITQDEFRKFRFKKCVYEYGKKWYEIKLDARHDLNASELELPNGKTLFDDVHNQSGKHKSENLLSLPRDSTVLIYHTSDGQTRHVPSGLCRLTYKTNHLSIKRIHSKAIMPPHKRKSEIEFVMENYFQKMRFHGIPIKFSHIPYEFEGEQFKIPDLKFGNNRVLSITEQYNGKVFSTLEEHGRNKRNLLQTHDGGFYMKKKLDAQYIILPKSVFESYGRQMIEDIKQLTNKMYPQPEGKIYDPMIITYDNSVEQSIPNLGKAIINAVQNTFVFPGYGLVIIPRLRSTRYNKEDELSNLVMGQMRKRGIHVSITHTEIPSRSYVQVDSREGIKWKIVDDAKIASRFRGYLANMILNKIMLLNSCWPFVLDSPMYSDLVIGIDVKNHTAGFTLIYKNQKLRSDFSESDQKEQLGKKQLETIIYDYIKNEHSRDPQPIKIITIHRDGRLFQNEINGIKNAIKKLSDEGIIDKDYICNCLAIRKTSSIPVRLFETKSRHGSQYEFISNPTIGTYKIIFDQAFLCNTGKPYWYPGTTAPLQIVKVEGGSDFKTLLEEVFQLSNLTWTKVDYCAKLPISIKMTDIKLREVAGEYDEDALKFGIEEEEFDE